MSATFKPVRPLGDLLRVLIAPAICFAHLAVVYAGEALICIGPAADQVTTMGQVVILATAAALTGLIILVAGLLRSRNASPPASDHGNSWFRRASLLIATLSALGVIWTTLPAAVLPACS